jgi:diacylglycerol O-acyltransferase
VASFFDNDAGPIERMTDADGAMYLLDQADPGMRTSATAVMILDRLPDRDRLLESFERWSRSNPRMRARVMTAPLSGAPPSFVRDRPFDIRFHVRFGALPEGATVDDLLELGAVTQMQDFDRARPLWWVQLVSGLEDGAAGLIFKFNHAIADAVGGLALLGHLFDLERRPKRRKAEPAAEAAEQVSPVGNWLAAQRHELALAARAVAAAGRLGVDVMRRPRAAAETVASVARVLRPPGEQLSPILRARSLSCRFDVVSRPLEPLKAAARANGGKLNDAVVAAVGEGMRLYHEQLGSPVDALTMVMPVSMRTEDDKPLGNRIVPVRINVRLDLPPTERIADIRQQSTAGRTEPGLAVIAPFGTVATRLPPSLVAALYRHGMMRGIDFYTSNVPGPPEHLYLAGARVDHFYPFGPMSNCPVNATVISYAGQLDVAIGTDAGAVVDPVALRTFVGQGLDAVSALGASAPPG